MFSNVKNLVQTLVNLALVSTGKGVNRKQESLEQEGHLVVKACKLSLRSSGGVTASYSAEIYSMVTINSNMMYHH